MDRPADRRVRRVLVAMTAHGFGHAAQVAPAINALRERLPDLEIHLWGDLDTAFLETCFDGQVSHTRRAADVGMVQGSPLDVDAAASLRAYEAFHATWEQGLEEDAELLSETAPDLVVCDVPYRPLVAARRLGIPAVALCSLDWADVLWSYCRGLPGAEVIRDAIAAAYAEADEFIAPEPAMPMPSVTVTRRVGPIARPARRRRSELLRALGAEEGTRLVLVGLGGVPMTLDAAAWPQVPGLRTLVHPAWAAGAPWLDSFKDLIEHEGFHFTELLASVDLYVTKPGYNSIVEAGVLGVPTLYTARGDWPEEPAEVAWLGEHTRCLEVSRQELESGAFVPRIDELLWLPRPRPAVASGNAEAARLLAKRLE